MKVKFIGISDPLGLINGKVYEVLAKEAEGDWYRVIDETDDDYLYPQELFEIVEDGEVPDRYPYDEEKYAGVDCENDTREIPEGTYMDATGMFNKH